MSSADATGQHLMTVPDLEPAARRLAALLDGVPDSALDAPTPCADTPVAGLLDHLMGLSRGSARLGARRSPTRVHRQASAANLDPQWRTILPKRLDAPGRGLARPGRGRGA